jgi:hypothetical protein
MVNDGRSSKNAGQAKHNGVKIDFKRIIHTLCQLNHEREYQNKIGVIVVFLRQLFCFRTPCI